MDSSKTSLTDRTEELVSSLADSIYTYANFLTECCIKIIDFEDYQEKEKRFFYSMLFKATNELTAVSTLFKNFHQKAAFQSSMFLILRTMLSDCFASWHVIKMKEIGEDFIFMINLIDYDHVSFSIKSLKGNYNQIHRLSKQQLEIEIQKIKQLNPSFFKVEIGKDGKKVFGDSIFGNVHYSMKNTITFLTNQKLKSAEKDLLKKMFHYYDYYSKLEHPGILTFSLTHKSFNHLAFKDSLKDFIETLHSIEPFMATYLVNWPVIKKSIDQQYTFYIESMFKSAKLLWDELKMAKT